MNWVDLYLAFVALVLVDTLFFVRSPKPKAKKSPMLVATHVRFIEQPKGES